MRTNSSPFQVPRITKARRASLLGTWFWALGLATLIPNGLRAQAVGDYRTNQSGDWDAPYTWQEWTGSAWIADNPQYSPGSVMAPSNGFPIILGTATSAKTSTANAAHTVDLPAGIAAGDLILILWTDADANNTVNTPTGYTQLYSNTNGNRNRRAWYKVATGSEGTSLVVATNTERSAHNVYRLAAGSYQGVPVVSSIDTGTDDNPDPPSLTSGFGAVPTLWIAASHSEGDGTVTAPANYTAELMVGHSGNTGSTHATMGSSYRFLSTATEDPGQYDLANNRTHAAATIAIEGAVMDIPYPNPVVVATTSGVQSVADVGSHTIAIPAGQAGELLVAVFSVDEAPTVSTSSTGWTKLGQASNGTTVTGAIFWKLASGTSPAADALTLTTSSNQRSSHVTYRIRGATGISGANSNGSGTNSNPASHTAAEDAFLWIATRAGDNTNTASVAPTNYTDLQTVGAGNANGASTNSATYLLGTAAATENPGAFTSATEQWVCYTLAILGPAPEVTYIPIDVPVQASGNGFPSVATTASSASVNNVSSHAVALPSGIQAGDLLLVFWVDRGTASTVTIPTGWTSMYNTVGSANQRRIGIYRIADGSEGSTLTVATSVAERSAHTAYRIAAGSYQGVPAVGAALSADSNAPDPPNLTTGFGNVPTLWIAAAHIEGNASATLPTNYGNALTGYTGAVGADHGRMVTATRNLQAASENPGAFALGTNRIWGANTVAIRGVERTLATVRNGHTITVTGTPSIDDLAVENGGTITISSGSLTVNGSSATVDGTINGSAGALVLGNTSGMALTVSGSGLLAPFDLTAASTGGVTMNMNTSIRGTLQLDAGDFEAVGTVSLASDASGTGRLGPVDASASYTGNLTVNRYIPAGKTNWRMMGSPVAGQTVNNWKDDFTTAGFPGSHVPWFDSPVGSGILWPSIRWYDEANTGATVNDGLLGVANTSQALSPGQGFAAWMGTGPTNTTAFTVDMIGVPHVAHSPIALPMSYTNTGVATTDGWNMVSNPLASPIAFDQISRGANVADYITYFDPATGNNATYDIGLGTGTNGGTNVIQSGQAFWLKANGPAVTTTVSESAKVSGNSGGFFGSQIQTTDMVRLSITSAINQFSDETVVLFNNGEPGADGNDVPKFIFAHPDAPQIATHGDGGEMIAINAYGPYSTDISIPVTVDVAISGDYTITATGLAQSGLTCLRLEDLATSTITPLVEGATYSFTALNTDLVSEARFVLHASAPLQLTATDATCNGRDDGAATVDLTSTATVVWSDANGAALLEQNNASGPTAIQALVAGEYTVSITSNEGCGALTTRFTVEEPSAMEATAVTEPTSCPATEDGTIVVEVLGGVGPYTYAWSNSATGEQLEVAAGTYSVVISDANGCTLAPQEYVVGAGEGPVAEISLESGTVSVDEDVLFVGATSDEVSHTWDFGDGTTSTDLEPTHSYSDPGTYTVTLTVDDGNCTSTTTLDIFVEASTGLPTIVGGTLNAYTSGDFIVVDHNFAGDQPVVIRVFSTGGQLAQEHRVASAPARITLPAAELATGIWMVRVSHGNNAKTFSLPVVH